ncbi:hypothetical protein [Paenibacillus protaetiae]|uniref:Uncharacterized protein n=1 Tax=Paenibacillus protaetiae TaxID=2509456 RepID=A0A4P6F3T6_9BACL|nr:hypothetical protein [Paenibacillus protaetiae]QAY65048.1 hypothetical protein ET464_00240 [Paenibacillus protaetiae]
MIIATLAGPGQLANAAVFARSVKQFHPEAYIILCITGNAGRYREPDDVDEVVFIASKPFESADLSPYKAYFIQSLVHTYNDSIIYMDPHSRLYGPIDELAQALRGCDLVGIPYFLYPQQNAEDEIERLKNGMMNAGLLALRPSSHTRSFAAWWLDRVMESCRSGNPAHSDHRWLSLAVTPFGIHIFKHPAYHFSAWNLAEKARSLTVQNGQFTVHGLPLKTACFDPAGGKLHAQVASARLLPVHMLMDQYQAECDAILSNPGKEMPS